MHNLNLNLVDTYSLSSMALADISAYDPHLAISNATIEITAPGFNKVSTIFTPKSVNVYNAQVFNIGCAPDTELPDGLYTVKYSVYPNDTTWVQKMFMRTAQIMCKYQRTFLAIDLHCSCNGAYYGRLKDELRNIRLLIEGSVAASNNCNTVDSMDMYKKANSLLDKLSKCQCNCK